ncbi:MAG: hypothetical protein II560_07375, partial [Bacteroidales bacterium]|nr:hypothetical protein [Bacteroidales bacterium]
MKAKDQKWVVTRIDGKVASVSADFRGLSKVAQQVCKLPVDGVSEITVSKISTSELADLSATTKWEDMRLSGSPFQVNVWHQLYLLTHHEDG